MGWTIPWGLGETRRWGQLLTRFSWGSSFGRDPQAPPLWRWILSPVVGGDGARNGVEWGLMGGSLMPSVCTLLFVDDG